MHPEIYQGPVQATSRVNIKGQHSFIIQRKSLAKSPGDQVHEIDSHDGPSMEVIGTSHNAAVVTHPGGIPEDGSYQVKHRSYQADG